MTGKYLENEKPNSDGLHSAFYTDTPFTSKSNNVVGPYLSRIIISISALIIFIKLGLIVLNSVNYKEMDLERMAELMRDEIIVRSKTSYDWFNNNYSGLISPVFIGCLVTVFSWMMIYLDSERPGINPPTPQFSPTKVKQYHFIQNERRCHFSYIIAIASGIVVASLLYATNVQN